MNATSRFDLRERISGGVSAEVYRAYDNEHDRDVVIRMLREGVDGEYVERFQRAAEDAADVRHANVVAVLDHGVIDGRSFMAREFVEGSTLDDLLARRGPLPEDEAGRLAAQIATGLSAAHARGLLHRDLSAGSVIVTPDGTAKVADFAMPGAPHHSAPEQIAGQRVDERTDIFGLGAVLYQMLTGHVPRGRPVSPRRLVPRVSKSIDAVAMRALEPDPARRYPTAAAMAAALRAAMPPVRPIAPAAMPPVRPVAPAAVPVATRAPRSPRPVVVPLERRRRSSMLPFALLALPLVALLLAGVLFARTQPTRTAVLSATTTPQAVIAAPTVSPTTAATVSPEPTSLAPVETTPEPTTEPTIEPTAVPTVAPPPPPPPTPPAPAPPAAVAPATQSAPVATVLSFYDLVNRKRFDEAAALWSPRMQASYPPSTNIYGRFDRTRQIIVRGIAQSAESAGAATVTVDLLETLDSGVTRHWVGQWQLVWDGTRWLMDAPNLRTA